MISVFTCNGGVCVRGGAEKLPPPDALPELVWIDLENPTPEEERRVLEQFFHAHPLTLEDITRPRRQPDQPPHFPKVEEFPDYLFVIVNPLTKLAGEMVLGLEEFAHHKVNTQLSAVLTHQVLITHHYEELISINELDHYLLKHPAQASRGPDYLFHHVLDVMVDRYAPLLDQVDASLDLIETEVFTQPSRQLLSRLLAMKRNIIGLRKTMIYEREVLARLSRGEFALIEAREMAYYRNVYDHLIRFTELIEASREMVMDLMQTHLAAQANKLNEIMKVLAMISTVILPMALIAGIYGMNFEQNVWPSYKSSDGFAITLVMMLVTAVASLGLFRWLKWL